jgi:hypothetical protein
LIPCRIKPFQVCPQSPVINHASRQAKKLSFLGKESP